MMKARCSLSFFIGILLAALLSPVEAAEPDASAKQPNLAEEMAKAEKFLDQQDLSEAMQILLRLAEQNNYTPAQSRIGEFVESAMDYEEAVGWYIMAASQGDVAGSYDLGRMYATGLGIERDLAKALYWTKRAANKDFLPAVQAMANAYVTGDLGVPADPEQAKAWGAKASRLEAKKKAEDEAALKAAIKKAQDEAAAKKAAK